MSGGGGATAAGAQGMGTGIAGQAPSGGTPQAIKSQKHVNINLNQNIMSLWSKVGDVFKSVGKGIVDMIPGMGISVASNAIGGAMSAKDAKRQHQYDLEKMATQHGYNIESQKLG